MSKRFQIVISDEQYREIAAMARSRYQTIGEWAHALLAAACRRAPRRDADRKIAAIRAAARHQFPTADIDEMLRQIESR